MKYINKIKEKYMRRCRNKVCDVKSAKIIKNDLMKSKQFLPATTSTPVEIKKSDLETDKLEMDKKLHMKYFKQYTTGIAKVSNKYNKKLYSNWNNKPRKIQIANNLVYFNRNSKINNINFEEKNIMEFTVHNTTFNSHGLFTPINIMPETFPDLTKRSENFIKRFSKDFSIHQENLTSNHDKGIFKIPKLKDFDSTALHIQASSHYESYDYKNSELIFSSNFNFNSDLKRGNDLLF